MPTVLERPLSQSEPDTEDSLEFLERSISRSIPELPFSHEELESFREEDANAGKIIGRILGTLFCYTVVITTIVILWTYQVAN